MLVERNGFPDECTAWALLGLKDVTCSVGGEDKGNARIGLGLMLCTPVGAFVVLAWASKLVTIMGSFARRDGEEQGKW